MRVSVTVPLVGCLLCAAVSAQVTHRVSVATDGTQGNDNSGYYYPSISADGRYVVFPSRASNLVSGDTNGLYDIFVRDCQLGTTDRASVSSAGVQADRDCITPVIS